MGFYGLQPARGDSRIDLNRFSIPFNPHRYLALQTIAEEANEQSGSIFSLDRVHEFQVPGELIFAHEIAPDGAIENVLQDASTAQRFFVSSVTSSWMMAILIAVGREK